jgi:hypothetical protein
MSRMSCVRYFDMGKRSRYVFSEASVLLRDSEHGVSSIKLLSTGHRELNKYHRTILRYFNLLGKTTS